MNYQLTFIILSVGTLSSFPQGWFEKKQIGHQVVPRDAFPVFDHPKLVDASKAEVKAYVHDHDPVIGVVINGEARAYPIQIMGVHELGNDSLNGVPIAVSW